MKPLIVIPARGGSVRIKDKNIQPIINDCSMLRLAASQVDLLRLIHGIDCDACISTDRPDYWEPQFDTWRIQRVDRPADLAGPTADIADAVRHALLEMEQRTGATYDLVVTLQPAVPCRTARIIANMLHAVQLLGCQSAVTGVPVVPWQWSAIDGRALNSWTPRPYPRSQDLPGLHWQEINSVQIARRQVVLAGLRWQLPLLVHLLPPYAVFDIDDQADLDRARLALPKILDLLDADPGPGQRVIYQINGLDHIGNTLGATVA